MSMLDGFNFEESYGPRCMWSEIAERDRAKVAAGNDIVTFSPDKPCYNCKGLKIDASSIGCTKFYVLRETQ